MAKRKRTVKVNGRRPTKRQGKAPSPSPSVPVATAPAIETPKPKRPPRHVVGALTRTPRKGGPGRRAEGSGGLILPEVEVKRRIRESQNRYQKRVTESGRDIGGEDWQDLVAGIDWDRRLACKNNLQLFDEAYMAPVFFMKWSQDQLICLRKIQKVFTTGGMFALAMPRGGGKTAICRGSIIWGTAYAHRRFPFFIGSTQPKAIQTLDFVKTYWFRSLELRQDFPEIAWPAFKLENRFHLAKGQLFNGEPTFIEWGSERVRYPTLIFTKEEARPFLENDPDSIHYIESIDAYIPQSGGISIGTAGIDGSIRGEAEVHPVTLEQPRPDVVLLDDIQKDQKADSPASCDKIIRLVDGAVQGLAGPGQHISALMPCTVIRDGDASDTYLDRMKKPEWGGERCAMVIQWPEGITDFEIGMDSKEGRLWNKYDEARRQSLRIYEDGRLATDLYRKNRKVMDKGFVVSWAERFNTDPFKGEIELSPQQHAMNLRLKAPESFAPEFQNRGRKLNEEGEVMISAEALAGKTISVARGCLPVDTQHLAAFIDVQDEVLFWAVGGCNSEFTGLFANYGTYPEINVRWFTKGQSAGWGMLTKEFFTKYPQHRDKAKTTNAKGKAIKSKAPFEAKIYHALSVAVPWLMNQEFIRQDGHETPMKVQRLAIDTRWGQASETIKRYIRECGIRDIVPYVGQSYPVTNKQLEEYTLTPGWFFEHQRHPKMKDPKWVIRPNPDGQFYMSADVNRLKDFLFSRLASPPGSPGNFGLFDASAETHDMFCNHVCSSEYPEPVTARGRTKNQWKVRDGRPDNDWLDCCVGIMALLSWLGASLKTTGEAEAIPRARRRLSDRWRNKRDA